MFKDILMPIDLEHESSWTFALPKAIEQCKAGGGNLHVMAVVPGMGMSIVGSFFPEDFEQKAKQAAQERLQAFVEENVLSDIESRSIIGNGTVYEEILRVAGEIGCDGIVMAASRPELKHYLLGPNAARVVRHANCSVLVVRD